MTQIRSLFPSPQPRISCLLGSTDAHPKLAAGVPPLGLLSMREQAVCEGFAVAKRRRDWLLGRWTAKHLVRFHLHAASDSLVPLDEIEILADDDGAPYARAGERLDLSLSISHSGSKSFCALCAGDAGQVGADVERVEPRDLAFVQAFFASPEIEAVRSVASGDRDVLVTALWSVKEAVLKSFRLGLRGDTREIAIQVPTLSTDWSQVAVDVAPGLLPAPSATVTAWCLIQPAYVLSLALISIP